MPQSAIMIAIKRLLLIAASSLDPSARREALTRPEAR
jgi:hypothetical protein